MGIPITAFFSETSERKNVIYIRAQERTRIPFSRGVWEGLGGEQFSGRVEPFMLTLESGVNSGPHTMAHSGHEFVFVLRGQLEYHVKREIFTLEAGDSLLFAGAGIVADSVPAREWRETELKFRPLAEALGGVPLNGRAKP